MPTKSAVAVTQAAPGSSRPPGIGAPTTCARSRTVPAPLAAGAAYPQPSRCEPPERNATARASMIAVPRNPYTIRTPCTAARGSERTGATAPSRSSAASSPASTATATATSSTRRPVGTRPARRAGADRAPRAARGGGGGGARRAGRGAATTRRRRAGALGTPGGRARGPDGLRVPWHRDHAGAGGRVTFRRLAAGAGTVLLLAQVVGAPIPGGRLLP